MVALEAKRWSPKLLASLEARRFLPWIKEKRDKPGKTEVEQSRQAERLARARKELAEASRRPEPTTTDLIFAPRMSQLHRQGLRNLVVFGTAEVVSVVIAGAGIGGNSPQVLGLGIILGGSGMIYGLGLGLRHTQEVLKLREDRAKEEAFSLNLKKIERLDELEKEAQNREKPASQLSVESLGLRTKIV